jgi:hypothetical protein
MTTHNLPNDRIIRQQEFAETFSIPNAVWYLLELQR